jgi:hypothetical protein
MDGMYLASCGADRMTTIRDARSGGIVRKLETTGEDTDALKACAFSPNSTMVAHGQCTKKGKVQIFDIKTGEILHEFEIKSRVSFLKFLDDKRLAVGGSVKDLTVYDLEKKKGETYNHKTPVNTGWSVSGTANLGVCGSRDKKMTLVNLKTMKMQKKQFNFGEAIKSTAVSNSGALVACGGKIKKLCVYVLPTNNEDAVPEDFPSVDVESDSSIETLSFSECEKILAVGDGKNQVNVYNIETVTKDSDEDVTLLHRIGLKEGLFSLRFNADSRTLGCAGKDNCVRVWDIGGNCDPYPYEFSIDWYLKHYVKKKPHLMYRQDYGDRGEAKKGNTIIHRVVEQGTAAMLKEYVNDVENFLPVENDSGLTPLDIAAQQNDFDKTRFLIEKYTENMTPALAGLPMFPRLLGANLKEGIHETIRSADDGQSMMDSRTDPYYSTLVYKFPELCAELLNKATIGVRDQTVDDKVTRMTMDIILKKPCDDFLPVAPLWTQEDEQPDGREVEVESFITGYKDFITRNGSFKTIVRSENADIFETTAMKRAIEYKWETYGLHIHNFMVCWYCLMVLLFLASLVFTGGIEPAVIMTSSSVVSIIIAYKEYCEYHDDKHNYLKDKGNLLDLLVILFIYLLTFWAWYDWLADGEGGVLIGLVKRLVISLQIGLCLLNLLLYLSSYELIGATYSMIGQVLTDFMPIFIVMILSICAYAIILRTLLLGPDPDGESPYDDDTSPFEEPSLHWTKVQNMVNIAFAFGFLGAYEDNQLQSTQEEAVGLIGTKGDVLNFFSWIFFVLYALFSNIILLNLLIAVMGDSYDRVKEREAVEQRIKRAKTLCDIDRVWGGVLHKHDEDLCFPMCLHFLTQKGKSAGGMDNPWEGKVKEMRLTVEKNAKDLTQTLKTELSDVKSIVEFSFTNIDKSISDKFKKLDKNMKELKFQMENLQKEEEEPAPAE